MISLNFLLYLNKGLFRYRKNIQVVKSKFMVSGVNPLYSKIILGRQKLGVIRVDLVIIITHRGSSFSKCVCIICICIYIYVCVCIYIHICVCEFSSLICCCSGGEHTILYVTCRSALLIWLRANNIKHLLRRNRTRFTHFLRFS